MWQGNWVHAFFSCFKPSCNSDRIVGILPAGVAISFLFVRAGMPTLRWVVFYVVWAFCPLVLQLIFCLCGQDAHTTVSGFFMY
jgi:hypothetical protein